MIFKKKRLLLLVVFCLFLVFIRVSYGDSSTSASVFIIPTLTPVIVTDFDQYSPNVTVEIIGLNYSSSGTVNLTITNASGVIVNTSIVSTNSTGGFTYNWTAISVLGNYSINGLDLSTTLYANKTIEIAAPYRWQGIVFNSSELAESSNVTVYYYNASAPDHLGAIYATDDETYNLTFQYGVRYIFVVDPIEFSPPLKQIKLDWVANTGQLGNIIGIDDVPLSQSTFKNFLYLVAAYINITDFESYSITISHSTADYYKVYKCGDWNFTERRCNADNESGWINVYNITDGATETNLTYYTPGDPGFGIVREAPSTPTPTSTGGGGGGGSSTIRCVVNWTCGAWGPCINGKQHRTCIDVHNCGTNTSKPSEEQTCVIIKEELDETVVLEEGRPIIIEEIIRPVLKHIIVPERDYLRLFILLLTLAIMIIILLDTSETLEVTKQYDGNKVRVLLRNLGKLVRTSVTTIVVVDEITNKTPVFMRTDPGVPRRNVKCLWEMDLGKFMKRFFLQKGSFVAHMNDSKFIVLKEATGCFYSIDPFKHIELEYRAHDVKNFEGIFAEYTRGKADTPEELTQQYAVLNSEYKKITDPLLKADPLATIRSLKENIKHNIPDSMIRRKVEEKLTLFELLFQRLE